MYRFNKIFFQLLKIVKFPEIEMFLIKIDLNTLRNVMKHSANDSARWDDFRCIFNFLRTQKIRKLWCHNWKIGKGGVQFYKRAEIDSHSQNFDIFPHNFTNNGPQRLKIGSFDSQKDVCHLDHLSRYFHNFCKSAVALKGKKSKLVKNEAKSEIYIYIYQTFTFWTLTSRKKNYDVK